MINTPVRFANELCSISPYCFTSFCTFILIVCIAQLFTSVKDYWIGYGFNCCIAPIKYCGIAQYDFALSQYMYIDILTTMHDMHHSSFLHTCRQMPHTLKLKSYNLQSQQPSVSIALGCYVGLGQLTLVMFGMQLTDCVAILCMYCHVYKLFYSWSTCSAYYTFSEALHCNGPIMKQFQLRVDILDLYSRRCFEASSSSPAKLSSSHTQAVFKQCMTVCFLKIRIKGNTYFTV